MTVGDLIQELKMMPKNLDVGFSSHDNTETEIQGWAFSVDYIIKSHYDEPAMKCDQSAFEDMPDEWVSIRC